VILISGNDVLRKLASCDLFAELLQAIAISSTNLLH
jgi:hypothetical protein